MSKCPSEGCNQPRRAPGELCKNHHAEREAARRAALRRGPKFSRSLDSHTYLITAAQNATPVHSAFLRTLRTAAEALGAELVVIPLRYRNPTSTWPASAQGEDVWAPELAPYLPEMDDLDDELAEMTGMTGTTVAPPEHHSSTEQEQTHD